MFDSLGGGYIPICLIVIASAWYLSKLKDIKLRVLMTVIVPIAVSLAWYFIPDFFRSNPDSQDPAWVTWGLIAATAWSIAAIPTSIISVYVFSNIRKKAELKTKTTAE
jgi:hypothetical protein